MPWPIAHYLKMLKSCFRFDNPLVVVSVAQFYQTSAHIVTALLKCFICFAKISRSRQIFEFKPGRLFMRHPVAQQLDRFDFS